MDSPSPIIVSPTSSYYEGRLMWFQDALRPIDKGSTCQENNIIDRSLFQQFILHWGIPDNNRSLAWKILLNYLPYDKTQWSSILTRKRASYGKFIQELVTNPYNDLDLQHQPEQRPKGRTRGKPNDEDTATLIVTSSGTTTTITSIGKDEGGAVDSTKTNNNSTRNNNNIQSSTFGDWLAVSPDDDPLNVMALSATAKTKRSVTKIEPESSHKNQKSKQEQ
eukprot:UN04845